MRVIRWLLRSHYFRWGPLGIDWTPYEVRLGIGVDFWGMLDVNVGPLCIWVIW